MSDQRLAELEAALRMLIVATHNLVLVAIPRHPEHEQAARTAIQHAHAVLNKTQP